VPSITALRISPPGFKASLIDISTSGLLAEWGVAVKIGVSVKVTFEGGFIPQAVQAHVVRSSVASMGAGGIRYHVALAFKEPLLLEDPPSAVEDQPAPAAVEDPELSDAVNRW
jgi:hypothetical protein